MLLTWVHSGDLAAGVSKPPSAQKKIWRRIPSVSRTLISLATCSNWFPRFVRGCNGNGGTTGSPTSLSALGFQRLSGYLAYARTSVRFARSGVSPA